MIHDFYYYFLVFFIFSFFGWAMEVINCSLIEKRLVLNRGFLIGPYCPIYGCGTVGLLLLIIPNFTNPAYLFIASVGGACLLEYITSYLMEKLFNARWWDYSHEQLNLNGRICLKTGLEFGLAGLVITYILLPLFDGAISILPLNVVMFLTYTFLVIFIVDLIVSIIVISKFKHTARIMKDNTNEISREVQEELKKSHFFTGRLIKAFPGLKTNYGEGVIDTLRKTLDGVEERITKEKIKLELKLAKIKKKEAIKQEKEAIKKEKDAYKETKRKIKTRK